MWIIFDGNVSVDLDKIDKIVIKPISRHQRMVCFQKVSSGHLATVHEVTVETVSLEELRKEFPYVSWARISNEAKHILQKKIILGAERELLAILAAREGALDSVEFSTVLYDANKGYLWEIDNEGKGSTQEDTPSD